MRLVYFSTFALVDFYGFDVGKYTSPMDPMGYEDPICNQQGFEFDEISLVGFASDHSCHFCNQTLIYEGKRLLLLLHTGKLINSW